MNRFWFYQVLFDGQVVYESTMPLDYPDQTFFIDLPIPPGTTTVELVINDNGERGADWSCWGWPMFHLKEGAEKPENQQGLTND